VRRPAKFLAGFGLVVLGLQAVRFPHTNPPAEGDLSAPPDVKQSIREACYDCHSGQTRWPWYTDVAPLSWFAYRDVSDGRQRLNFSSWTSYTEDPDTAVQKLDQISRFVASGDMAPWYYRWLHPEAHLDEAKRAAIFRWIESETAALRSSSSS
jgi:hypothetical protein